MRIIEASGVAVVGPDNRSASSFDLDNELQTFGLASRGSVKAGVETPGDMVLVAWLMALEARLINRGLWAAGPTTLFGVLRLRHREVENCRVLAWILDPLAPHGLGTAVLRKLLVHLSEQVALPQAALDSGLERTTITVEGSRSESRADLVLQGRGWTIVIEAKINAGEQIEQGMRLAADWPDAAYVFLTRSGADMRTAGENHWAPLTWQTVGRLINEAFDTADTAPTAAAATARSAVRDYLIATGHREHKS